MEANKKKIYVVAGPTAVGKTKYAIDLAKKINGEIVSLDSMQVYKGFDIGTAKIKENEKEGIIHYMIDIVEPDRNLSIKEFKDEADKCIDKIYKKGKIPILVGGTGFYIRAILYDTDFLYEDEEKALYEREKLYDILEEKGIDFLYDELKKIDGLSAERIPKGNEKRVIRAIEFFRLHGFPISEHNDNEKSKEAKYDFKYIVLYDDREKLYDRINKRVDRMIEEGFLIEVKRLIDKGYTKDLNSMKGIGYSELYDFCKERSEIQDIDALNDEDKKILNEKIELIKKHTRNYAKRQLTWFRSQEKIFWKKIS